MALVFDNPTANLLRRGLMVVSPLVLALGTAYVLLSHIPSSEAFSSYTAHALVYALLTAIALFFGVLLAEDEISAAHIVGMLAFLSLPADAQAMMLWAVFLGGVVGGGFMIARAKRRLMVQRRTARRYRDIIFIPARVTLSYFAGAFTYLLWGGKLPITLLVSTEGSASVWNAVIAVAVYGLVYTAVYGAILTLEAYSDRRPVARILRTSFWQITALLIVPIPFVVLAAEVISRAAPPAFIFLILGLAMIFFVLNALSRSEDRLRKQLNELRSLSVVTQAMRAHLDLSGLLTTIYIQIAHLFDAENFLVALYDRNHKELDFPLIIRHGRQDDYADKPKDIFRTALLDYVLQNHTALLLSDNVAEQAQKLGMKPPQETIYSWLGVPLIAGGRTLGAIVITSHDARQHFYPDDLRLLNIVAASASIAIENAQLYREQTERAEQLATLNIVSALLAETLSLDTVLDTIISSASTIAIATAVAIYLYADDTKNALSLVRCAGFSDDFAPHAPTPLLAGSGENSLDKPPLVINDVTKDKRAAHLQSMMADEHKAAWIELPLLVGTSGLGVLCVYFDQPQFFAGDTIEFLRTFANQAAQAINNAHLYMRTDAALDRHVEQLFSLASTGRLLTATMDIRKMCEIVLTYATDATKSEVGLIALRDETGKRWEIMSQRGYSDDALRQTDLLLSQQLLPNGQPFRSDDVQQVKDYTAVIPATHSLLLMPILRGKEMVGVIRLESPNRDAFSEEDSYFVGQLANQAVISFDNMRLFQRITEARDRLQVLLNAMEEAILLIDSTGIVALANPRVKLIGLEPSKLVGQSIDALLSQKDLTFAAQLGFIENPEELRELVSSLQAHTWRETTPVTYSVSGDGTLHIQRQIIPVRDEKGEAIGILMVFYNKTEEQHLTEAREQLSQMIVHDLRSPLTAVTTSLKLLRELVPTDSDFRSVVMTTTDASQRAIRKLLTRVDSLLDIAKMESGQLTLDTEPTELATLADSVCVELSPLAHELEVEVTSEIDESLPLLDIDADKVERMLLNLVDNALKYTPADSRVTIRAFPPGKNGAPDDFVRIDVADRGPGVPEDYKTRLFDRYVQIEGRQKVRRGVGLGLTFCRLVAEAHGGRIWIEDNPGGGSIFSLTLPIIREDLLSLDKPETPAIDGKSTADDAAQKHDLRFKDPS